MQVPLTLTFVNGHMSVYNCTLIIAVYIHMTSSINEISSELIKMSEYEFQNLQTSDRR